MNFIFKEKTNTCEIPQNKIDAKFILLFSNFEEAAICSNSKSLLNKLVNENNFKFNNANFKVIYGEEKNRIFIALKDKKENFKLEDLKKALNQVYNISIEHKFKNIEIYIQDNNLNKEDTLKTIAEIYEYNNYKFDRYLSEKNNLELENIYLIGDYEENDKIYLDEATKLGKIVNKVRFTIDEPSSNMYPEVFVEYYKNLVKELNVNIDVSVYDKKDCEEFGMNCYLAVAKGSAREPKLLVMRYNGNPNSDEKLALVGKGITYDSGGYSIKPTNGMVTMKNDMSGAATVMGTICAIAQANLKINVVAVAALCENAVSGTSYKPGDIYKSMNGKTVFIGNTDAEGRVTLIDAITYAIRKENATKIIDVATLTGAQIVALGDMCSAVMTNNQEFLDKYLEAANYSCEYAWQLPAFDMYKEYIKHYEGDLTNTANGVSGAPGTITAGLFLGEFVEGKDWIHVDFAGPAHMTSPRGFYKKGATGHSVKTLYELAKKL